MSPQEALARLNQAKHEMNTAIMMLEQEIKGGGQAGMAQPYLISGIAQLKFFLAQPFGNVCQHGGLQAICPHHGR